MTTVQITLPDALAREATLAGLLAPGKIERILRELLRQEPMERMQAARAALADEPLPPMTSEEISAEINAYRAEQRRAALDRLLTLAPALETIGAQPIREEEIATEVKAARAQRRAKTSSATRH